MKKVFLLTCIVCVLTSSMFAEKKTKEEQLIEAVIANDYKECQKLLKKKVNVDSLVEDKSLLCFAIEKNQTEIALLLIDSGADVNWTYTQQNYVYTPFYYAIANENTIIVDGLIKSGVDLNVKARHGLCYFTICVAHKRFKILNYLLASDKFLATLPDNTTIWNTLIWYWSDKTPEIIKIIFKDEVKLPPEEPLPMIAIDNFKMDALKWLYENGFDFSKSCKYKFEYDFSDLEETYMTPLEAAKRKKAMLMSNKISEGFSEDSSVVQEVNAMITYIESIIKVNRYKHN